MAIDHDLSLALEIIAKLVSVPEIKDAVLDPETEDVVSEARDFLDAFGFEITHLLAE